MVIETHSDYPGEQSTSSLAEQGWDSVFCGSLSLIWRVLLALSEPATPVNPSAPFDESYGTRSGFRDPGVRRLGWNPTSSLEGQQPDSASDFKPDGQKPVYYAERSLSMVPRYSPHPQLTYPPDANTQKQVRLAP